MKGKETADNLSLTINNSVNKKEAHVVNSHEVKAQENVQTSFKLVHNYPLSDNFKVKVSKKFNNFFLKIRLLLLMILCQTTLLI